MLLEELAKKETLNVDFHNHLQTGSSFRTKPKNFREWFKNLFLEEGFSNLTGILDRVMKTNLDVLYITNFGDETRYENWTSAEQIITAIKAGYEIQQGQYYIFAKKGERVIALGKSQEVPTTQGHMLFAGLARNKKFSTGRSLDETLAEATFDKELKIADHPYAMLKGQNGIMAYSKDNEKDAKKIDALERNGNFALPFSFANLRGVRNSRKYHKPLISDSDGHHPKDIGKTYNIFSSGNIDYSLERAFRYSINYNVREGNFKYRFRPIPIYRVFHHAYMIGIHKLSEKLGKYIERLRGIVGI